MVGEKKRGAKKVGVGVGGCFAADAQSNAKEREPEWVGSQRRAPMHRLKPPDEAWRHADRLISVQTQAGDFERTESDVKSAAHGRD